MVQVRHDVRVRARDGIELSVDLFLPDDLATAVPAIVNMDPYRKDDWSAAWGLSLGTYFADRGFAYCRLDVRGTGSSGGVAHDEYTEAETLDGHDTVEWLAAQPWCSGRVGMWGLSYGGFTSIQVAATRPPHLRAIAPIQATDDRYTDDVHYVGGALTVSELAQYAVSQVAMNAMPALPSAWGEGAAWHERWRERLEATPVWLFRWHREQHDGAYWRQGSLAPDYGRIQAAILSFGGWMDGYVDAALRMQARCTEAAGRRTIIGPWVHGMPDHAYPAPNIDALAEIVRWFDRWLKDEPNGADTEPALTWFHRDPTSPERFPKRFNGSWRATAVWPLESPEHLVLALDGGDGPGAGRLVVAHEAGAGRAAAGRPAGVDTFAHRPTAGSRGGSLCWGAGHPPNGLALDLRLEADAGPSYTSDPLPEPVDVLGPPVAVLEVAASRPVAHLVVRLGCVAPDGAIEQVSEGLLNLTHRESHARPTALEPGRRYEVRVPLRAAGFRFPAGSRIQLSVASSHWPVIWPSPGAGELSIHRGPGSPSRLELPLAPEVSASIAPPAFDEQPASIRQFGSSSAGPSRWETIDDVAAGTVTIRTFEAETNTLPDNTSTLYIDEALEMVASDREPGHGRFENACQYRLDRDGRHVVIVADGTTIASDSSLDMSVRVRVELDGRPFFERSWREAVPRLLA
jgi:putative CocE/NonD family hydrolase